MADDKKNVDITNFDLTTGDYQGSVDINRTIIGSPNDDIINIVSEVNVLVFK